MRIAKGILYAVLAVGVAAAQKANGGANEKTANQTSTTGETSSSATTKVETRTFKGDLVNAKCAGGGESTRAKAAPSKNSGDADRSAGTGDQACAVSSSTSEFAIKTKDGKTLPFDLVGNLRTQDALKNNKKWTSAASSGKPIKATVSGTEHNGMLTVLSVH